MSRSSLESPPGHSELQSRDELDLDPYDPEELDGQTDVGYVVAVLGSASRKGPWAPSGTLRVLALLGNVSLDFRDADLLDVTEVQVLSVMGNVTIIVPPFVDADASGLGLLGGFDVASSRTDDLDAPLVRIRGCALMGGVDVKVKKLPLKSRLLRSDLFNGGRP